MLTATKEITIIQSILKIDLDFILCMIAGFKKNKRRKLDFKKTLLSIFLVLIISAITIFLTVMNIRINQKRAQLSEKVESLKNEIKTAEERNKELTRQVSQSSQEEFIEKEARERLNLKKPGENVLVVVPPPAENKGATETNKNFFQILFDKIRLWAENQK